MDISFAIVQILAKITFVALAKPVFNVQVTYVYHNNRNNLAKKFYAEAICKCNS